MRKLLPIAGCVGLAMLLPGCAKGGLNRQAPDEYAVGRQAPLVIPPDYSLTPPQPGAPRPQDNGPAAQALDAMFGGTAPRSATESQVIDQTGMNADPGIRSAVGSSGTNVVDKGTTTQAIVSAPAGNGETATAATPGT